MGVYYMLFRSLVAATALVAASPAAALDVIASFTPVNTNTGNFAPVKALLTGLVEGNNLGSNIGFTVIASPIAGTLGSAYFQGRSDYDTFNDNAVALIVTNGVVTKADFYWFTATRYFQISKDSVSIPQIMDFNTNQYADTFDYGTGGHTSTSFVSVGATVPEPASWALLIAGFGLVGAFQRRRAAAMA
jgi:hypothetical protein